MYNKLPCTHLSDPTLSPYVLKSRFQIKCLFSLSIIQHTYLTEKGIKKKKKGNLSNTSLLSLTK